MEKTMIAQKIKSTNVRLKENAKDLSVEAIRALFKLNPNLANRVFTDYFFHPSYMQEREIYKQWSDKAEKSFLRVKSSEHHIQTYSWGEGPVVILTHGWAGRGLQLYSFIEPLVDKGFKVVAFDAPAHGNSTGFSTNYFDFYLSIQTIIDYHKDVHGIIAHSMGCGGALANLLPYSFIKKTALIAPQYDIEKHLDVWMENSVIGLEHFKTTKNFLEQKYQLNLSELNPRTVAPKVESDVLLIHDRNDEPCAHTNSVSLNRDIKNSELYLTDGLGHYRILKNEDVIEKIINFIAPAKDSE